MLEILYQDEYLVAVNKPAGMLVHRSWLDTHETQFVMQTLRDQIGQHVFPIHRLDRPTSGVLLFALNSEIANLMCQQFEQKTVQKSYLAIVRGYLQDEGQIDYPLKIQLDKIADKFAQEDKAPQEAVTEDCGNALYSRTLSNHKILFSEVNSPNRQKTSVTTSHETYLSSYFRGYTIWGFTSKSCIDGTFRLSAFIFTRRYTYF